MSTRQLKNAVIVESVRTPIGRAKRPNKPGMLSSVRPDDLSILVIEELVRRSGIDTNKIEDIRWGCAFIEGEQGGNVGRMAALLAGIPVEVSACTINRFCSSSLEALNSGVMAIMTGNGDVIIAGGVDSQSFIPMGGLHGDRMLNPKMFEKAKGQPQAYTMPQTAQYVAEKWGVSRKEQDEYAQWSQEKAIKALDAGKFKGQIVPVPVKQEDDSIKMVDTDECPRRGTSVEKMSTLNPIVAPIMEGSKEAFITAGNSCPINDGAAAILLVAEDKAEELGFKRPWFRVIGMSTAGVAPYEMGIGPIPATAKALKRAGLKMEDIDLIELNEAFASQCIAFIRDHKVDRSRLNVNGGAIALGHPFGMTGARLMTMLTHEMKERPDARYGLATLCVGGGMGMATIVEKIE